MITLDSAEKISPRPERDHVEVTQDPRRLFDTVEAAWSAWLRRGRPDRTRIGITARTDGTQHAWLDSPDSGVTWPLPT